MRARHAAIIRAGIRGARNIVYGGELIMPPMGHRARRLWQRAFDRTAYSITNGVLNRYCRDGIVRYPEHLRPVTIADLPRRSIL